MLTQKQIKEHAASVVGQISTLSAGDALNVLHFAMQGVIHKFAQSSFDPSAPVFVNPALLRSRYRKSKIATDPELRDFIHSLPGELRYEDIIDACRNRFPESRVPSRSALQRYVSGLKDHYAVKPNFVKKRRSRG